MIGGDPISLATSCLFPPEIRRCVRPTTSHSCRYDLLLFAEGMALSCAGAEELLGAAGFAKTEDQLEVGTG